MDEAVQYHLSVGTEVSAKYRGAFCEAKIKTVKKTVIFRVSNKKDGKTYQMNEELLKGILKVGNTVEAQFNDSPNYSEGVIMSTKDKSVYTVEFDDGDVRTLPRGSLCLQGVRHYAESETLDHLPLTDPENFGTPVLSSKRKAKRKTPQTTPSVEEDMDSDELKTPESNAKKKLLKTELKEDSEVVNLVELRRKFLSNPLMGKLVIVEPVDKRKHWYPAVCVNPLCYEDMDNQGTSHAVVRSFKTGKISKVTRFEALTKNSVPGKVEPTWKECLDDAFLWSDKGEVPDVWKTDIKDILDEEEMKNNDSNKDEKRDSFLEQLYKFMEDRGSPLNKTPVLGYKDLNLYLLFNLVQAKGGFHSITLSPDWREIYSELGIPKVTAAAGHHVKMAYTKYLLRYEEYRLSFALPPKKVATAKKRRNSGRLTPTLDESDTRRTTRRRRVSETVATDDQEATPPPPVKRGRKSRADQRDSDLDDASSTTSSEKSTTRGRLSSESGKTQRLRSTSGQQSGRKKPPAYKIGDKLRIKYGRDSFKLYNAKVVDVDADENQYYVHYAGWNSRHDEWIKAWQVSGVVNDNGESPVPNSPAPGSRARRPRTPVEEHKGVSQALDFGTPPKVATETAPSSGATKARVRRRSSSASVSVESFQKRAEDKMSDGEEENIVVKEEEKSVAEDVAAETTGRSTPPLVTAAMLAGRRMSSRRSKSPAYLRESPVYGTTKRRRTTSTASTNDTTVDNDGDKSTSGRISPLAVENEDSKTSKNDDELEVSEPVVPEPPAPCSEPETPEIVPGKAPKNSLAARIKTTCLNTAPSGKEKQEQEEKQQEKEQQEEEKQEENQEEDTEEEESLEAQEKTSSPSPEDLPEDEEKSESVVDGDDKVEEEEEGDSPPPVAVEAEEEDAVVPPIEMEEEEIPILIPHEAPSSSKVLIENTPPTTPEGSPDHYFVDTDHQPPCDSGASSMSGEVLASGSSPSYPPNSEAQEEEEKSKRKKSKSRKTKSKSSLESESEDEMRSKRRKSGRRKSKKPEPPSAPTPVICEELARLAPDERIRVLQAHLSEMRSVYQQLKQEVLSIDRKRKRAKKRESEVNNTPTKKVGLPNKSNSSDLQSSSASNGNAETKT